jgi:hypothetical protein
MWLADLLVDLLGIFDRSNTLYAAYRAAWDKRLATGEASAELLSAELKVRSVPGAYDPADSPRVEPAFRAWTEGTTPREAKKGTAQSLVDI